MKIKIKKIIGERIYLKLLEESNVTREYCDWLNDPAVNKYLTTKESTIDELRQYIKKQVQDPNSFFVGIFEKTNDLHIGNIKLEPIDWKNKKAVFGILIGNKSYWNKGIGTEATKLICDYAFKKMGMEKVELGVIASNIPAIKSYEKVGFKVDKIEKNVIRQGDKLFDKIEMSIKK
ncbi:N-acetyltransferase [bacterium (Candidatus Gribaldobacteria) CG_4_10_14_0_2_um_filter_41_16]|uniref:N-acetyltransferase n=1 Tax=bacterium (Candidatus Gribaldobacteria) CG_4_10_14_0_2_um_filter_41_16 TaxID=2014265 RepID=A0A2M7VJE2_9BACT|nr:MAG: N-acetyltransferase [bacterium (Candidatus Gribaldobacteria) CG_4_10_14_0_2_um_filter_41_16]